MARAGSRGRRRRAPAERHREEMLDPAVVGERLERRHPPVLGASPVRGSGASRSAGWGSRCPRSSRPRGSGRRRTPPPANGSQPRQSTCPAPGAMPARATPRGDRDQRPGQRDTGEAAPDARGAEHERRPERRAEREGAEEERVSVLEEHRGEADPGRHRGDDDPGPPARRAQRRDEREGERRDDDEAVERRRRPTGRTAPARRARRGGRPRRLRRPRCGHVSNADGEAQSRRRRASRPRRQRQSAKSAGTSASAPAATKAPRRGGRLEERPRIHDDRTAGAAASTARRESRSANGPRSKTARAPRGATCRAGRRRAPPRRRRGGAAPGTSRRRAPGVRRGVDGDEGARAADGGPRDERVRHDLRPRRSRRRAPARAPTALCGAISSRSAVPCAGSAAASASSASSQSGPMPRTRWSTGSGAATTSSTLPRAQGMGADEPRRRTDGVVEARGAARPGDRPASTSRTTAMLSRGASSSSRTISSPRRADVGQCTARRGSPSTYSRTPWGSSPLARRTSARRPPSPHVPVSVKSVCELRAPADGRSRTTAVSTAITARPRPSGSLATRRPRSSR